MFFRILKKLFFFVMGVIVASLCSFTSATADVPAINWSYGCSPTAAAMMFGRYDNTGYPDMYTGPTNGGVFPMTNTTWGSGDCPLSIGAKT